MTIASVMAELDKPHRQPGAPIPKDEVDPELVKLARRRTKLGVITCAGLVFLSALFVWRLSPDRKFGGASSAPEPVTVADILDGNAGVERHVQVSAMPIVSGAIRATTSKGTLGLRVVPVRGTSDKLWLVMSGDGGEPPTLGVYSGRLRKLDDLALAPSVRTYAAATPRPMFATAAAARDALASGKLATTLGDTISVADGDRVAYDVVDPDLVRVACHFGNDKLKNADEWTRALADAGITPNGPPTKDTDTDVSFVVAAPNALATVTQKLGAARINLARVEPIVRHTETTWGALRGKPLDSKIDLVGVYATRAIPDGAYAVVVGEKPDDYWYVLWVTIAVAAIGLAFAWQLVRAVRRDLVPTRV